ncbi:MAG: Lar family restriction alleviation protein [Synergistaceae bacterium]|nr:Lar family restriction alleviation protein [Synergistaceae bacterium]
MSIIKLKPCIICGQPYMLVYITGCTEANMRGVLDMSVKCETCGYECKLGTLREDSIAKAYKAAAKAWNRRFD